MLKSSKRIGMLCLVSYIFMWAFFGIIGFVIMSESDWKEVIENGFLKIGVMETTWSIYLVFSILALAFVIGLISKGFGFGKDTFMFFLYSIILYGIHYLMFATRDCIWLTLYTLFMLLTNLGIKCYHYYKRKQMKT